MRVAACPGWWPWGLLCCERWSYCAHLPGKSPALSELDVDTGYLAGTWACVAVLPGLGGGWRSLLGAGPKAVSSQSQCGHPSFVRCSGKADGVLFLGNLSVPSSLLGSSEK